MALALLGLTLLTRLGPEHGTPVLTIALGLLGLGIGLFLPANTTCIMASAPSDRLGVVGGIVNMTRGLGTALGIAATGVVLTTRLSLHAGRAAVGTTDLASSVLLAGFRDVPSRVTATTWGPQSGRSLFDEPVVVLGGGGITGALLALLVPFRCRVTVVRKRPAPLEGAADVVGPDRLLDVLAGASAVVVALALTPETQGIIDAQALAVLPDYAWLVNVGRGGHVVTDDLVAALDQGSIGGAALDVTDPEPLPDGHPLWGRRNCIITPHTANTFAMALPHLSARITENVRRFGAGEPLVGLIDPALGY